MNQNEAIALLHHNIALGRVDPVTHETSCSAVLELALSDPDIHLVLKQALDSVISAFTWRTEQQVENAAYLAVNIGDPPTIVALAMQFQEMGEDNHDFISTAIAAIRSYPEAELIQREATPLLFGWLESECVGLLAFEALVGFEPDHAEAYMLALTGLHYDHPAIVRNALTHLYFQGGDTERGKHRVKRLVRSGLACFSELARHELLPIGERSQALELLVSELSDEARQLQRASSSSAQAASRNSAGDSQKKYDLAQEVVMDSGSTWGRTEWRRAA